MKITLGCDPELFIKDSKTGKIISGEGIIPGNKKKPHKVRKGAVQLDGVACEFNIEPASNENEWNSNIQTVLLQCHDFLPKGHEFAYLPSVVFEKKYFEGLSAETKELGCDPDYSAYSGDRNPVPNDPGCMRTASGHVHIGFTEGQDLMDPSHFWDCSMLTKRCDKYFSNFFHLWDTDNKRRQMYGMEGSFRPKSYGVEYRVPSCAWVKYPQIWTWMFQSFQFIVDHAESGKQLKRHYEHDNYYDAYGYPRKDAAAATRANRMAQHTFGEDAPVFPENFVR